MSELGAVGGLWVLLVLFALLVLVLWVLMPFAIFGTKTILRDLLRQQQRTNELLEQWARERNGRS